MQPDTDRKLTFQSVPVVMKLKVSLEKSDLPEFLK